MCRELLPAFTFNRPLANIPLTNNPAGLWVHASPLQWIFQTPESLETAVPLEITSFSLACLQEYCSSTSLQPFKLLWLLTALPPPHLVSCWGLQGHHGAVAPHSWAQEPPWTAGSYPSVSFRQGPLRSLHPRGCICISTYRYAIPPRVDRNKWLNRFLVLQSLFPVFIFSFFFPATFFGTSVLCRNFFFFLLPLIYILYKMLQLPSV